MRGRSYTAKVVDRDVVGRPSGKKESTVEPLLAASGRCYCSSSYFCLSSRSPRPGLFIPLSVTASLSFATSSLFLSFCPFSASANDSRLFIPRLCIARERARALLRLLTTAVPSAASVLLRRYFASLPFRSLLLSFVSFSLPLSLNCGQACASETSTARHFAHEHREMRSMREAIPRLHHLSTRDRVPTSLYYMQHVASR